MRLSRVLSFIAFIVCTRLAGANVYDTLHITQGHLENIENNTLQVLNFNQSEEFELSPYVIRVLPGDILALTVVNHDSVSHEIHLSGKTTNELLTILPGQSGSIEISGTKMDIIKVTGQNPKYKYLGLSTMIVVDDIHPNNYSFYWNLGEIQVNLLQDYDNQENAAEADYIPEYFTINNQSYPHILKDPTAYVKGKIGDTLTVYMYNSGWLHHNFHLHGYHARIAFSSNHPNHVGRWKDSVPIDSDQIVVLEIVPHQAGLFPMHNHNLGATVGTNQYPNNTGVTICGSDDTPLGTNIYPYGMVTRIEVTAK